MVEDATSGLPQGDRGEPHRRAQPGTDDHPDAWHVGTAGVSEAVSVPWPILARRWMIGRARRGDRYRWWVLWTVLAGLFSVNVTFTIFAVALPRIAGELDTTENTLTWVITGPLLAFGVVAPILGKAGDLWGHRRMYLLGMVGACVFAALSAVAPTAGSLILVRTLSAVQGAATGASSMALIFSVFQREDRVKAMGWWSLVGAGGPVLGVAIGGPAIEAFGWRWIFAVQVPLTLAALVLGGAILHETERKSPGSRLDWQGGIAITLGVTSLLFAFNRGPEWGWASPAVVGAFALGPLALAAFVAVERRASSPLLPLEYLRRRNFSLPIAAQLFANFAYMGGFILAPSLLSEVYGYGESRIGFLVLSRPLAFSLVAPVAGYAAVRIGERVAAVSGTALVVSSMVVFAALSTSSPASLVLVALVLSGAGLGMAQPSISASIANSVDEADLGVASAAQQLITHVGIVAGIQLMKTIQISDATDGLPAYRSAYLLGAGVSVLAVLAAAFVRSSARGPLDDDDDRAGAGSPGGSGQVAAAGTATA